MQRAVSVRVDELRRRCAEVGRNRRSRYASPASGLSYYDELITAAQRLLRAAPALERGISAGTYRQDRCSGKDVCDRVLLIHMENSVEPVGSAPS